MSALKIFRKFRELLDVDWAAIADGQFLQRSGTSIVGADAPVGSSGIIGTATYKAASDPFEGVLTGIIESISTGIGNDVIFFTEDQPDTNYLVLVTLGDSGEDGQAYIPIVSEVAKSVSSFQIKLRAQVDGSISPSIQNVNVVVIRP